MEASARSLPQHTPLINAPIKVNAMPTQNPTMRLRPVARNVLFSAGCAFMIFASSGTAQAAIQEETSEGWFSTIFSMYGITVMLIGLLAALVLYKRYNAKKEAEEMMGAGGRRRNQAEPKNYQTPEESLPAEPTMLPERRTQPVESAQVWEKPVEY
jgi:hypothetical protein